jgi:hypothetical protein
MKTQTPLPWLFLVTCMLLVSLFADQAWSFNLRVDELQGRTLKRFHAARYVAPEACNPHKPQKQLPPQNK